MRRRRGVAQRARVRVEKKDNSDVCHAQRCRAAATADDRLSDERVRCARQDRYHAHERASASETHAAAGAIRRFTPRSAAFHIPRTPCRDTSRAFQFFTPRSYIPRPVLPEYRNARVTGERRATTVPPLPRERVFRPRPPPPAAACPSHGSFATQPRSTSFYVGLFPPPDSPNPTFHQRTNVIPEGTAGERLANGTKQTAREEPFVAVENRRYGIAEG